MPTKTTKKTATKPVAKKAPAKKAVKKVVAPAPVIKPAANVEIPLPSAYCHCTKRKRNTILTCVSTSCLLIGFLISHFFFCCNCVHHKRMPELQFVNGCVDTQSIKCPKMLQDLPMIDVDHDGCVTRDELRAAKKNMRHDNGPKPEHFVAE